MSEKEKQQILVMLELLTQAVQNYKTNNQYYKYNTGEAAINRLRIIVNSAIIKSFKPVTICQK